MNIIRFGLGLRFDVMAGEEGQITPGQLWEEIFSVLTTDDAKGIMLYGGMEQLAEGSTTEPCYICAFTNGRLKQMRRIYRKLESDAGINMYLAAARPYLQSNELMRTEGLSYYGKVQSGGTVTGGDTPFFGVHIGKTHGKRRPIGKGIVFLLAPDAFFNTLTSRQAIRRLTVSARKQFLGVRVHPLPVADGGPGTVDAILTAAHGVRRAIQIQGPQGVKREARYAVLRGDTALIEMPECFLPPFGQEGLCSSFGVGELIRRALDEGLEQVIVGLSNSCINDGGLGCLRALGVKLLDETGAELASEAEAEKLARIDTELLHPRVRNTRFVLMTDCSAPLDYTRLHPSLRECYGGILSEAASCDPACMEGAGAAGGLGAALMCVLGAERKTAITALLDAVEFDRRIRNVSLVVTGEGRIDHNSIRAGGAVGEILARSAKQKVPVAVVAGHIGEGGEELLEMHGCSIMIVADAFATSDVEVMVERFDSAAERMFRFIRLGREIERVSSRVKL